MKKFICLLLCFCFLISCFPLAACATEANPIGSAYAVIKDENGNILEHLDIEVSVSEATSNSRSGSSTRTITYTARSSETSSGTSAPMDGITATLSISWNDFLGIENQANIFSGAWAVGDETISSRFVYYSAYDVYGNCNQPLSKTPSSNSFSYTPSNFTGYRFYLTSYATIASTGNRLEFTIHT